MRFMGHKYTWRKPFTSIIHQWELRGPEGGIHFHVHIHDNNEYDPSCGLEYHHTPRWYGFQRRFGNDAPHHLNCPILGGICWHDGTSLYASEQVWPIIKEYLKDGEHEAVFRYLEGLYDDHFSVKEV